MAVDLLEKRLARLEQEVKNLKATYSVNGGLARMFVQSQSFSLGNPENNVYWFLIKVRFVPTYKTEGGTLINLSAVSNARNYISFVTEPQASDGSIIIKVFGIWNYAMNITIIASGTSPGTFERLQ